MRRFRELAAGVLIATADFAATNSVAVVAGDGGCLVIDPAISVADLSGLAADLAGSGLRARLGFATHPHWDHVLWNRELGAVPRYAAPRAVTITLTERDGMVRQLQRSAPGHDLDLFGQLVPLPEGADAIAWDGPAARLIIHDGHAPGHAAVFLPDSGVLVAGDMLSDTEIPVLDTVADDPLGDYRAGLALLGAVPGVRWLVPGHGNVADAGEFRRRVAADTGYLDLLAAGKPFHDPRCTKDWMRDAHERQLRTVAGLS
ncbi:MBL fold metallo-hydrolase [Trebonia sp.]|uniref:MBL fold metallo-hydrolase n=1 Tax=Trebonia sp. TaxID=2767075 RepID=UPI002630AEDE|nr:MBL fold metallo-hydrolase [Trebonia sp.]